jgi:hypothetical protein
MAKAWNLGNREELILPYSSRSRLIRGARRQPERRPTQAAAPSSPLSSVVVCPCPLSISSIIMTVSEASVGRPRRQRSWTRRPCGAGAAATARDLCSLGTS